MQMYHTVPGLEHAKIVRNAYAIEYDCIPATTVETNVWNSRKSVVCSAAVSLMAVRDTRKRRHRD